MGAIGVKYHGGEVEYTNSFRKVNVEWSNGKPASEVVFWADGTIVVVYYDKDGCRIKPDIAFRDEGNINALYIKGAIT